MKHIYRPAAADDIDRVYARYEEEREGLGEEFLAEAGRRRHGRLRGVFPHKPESRPVGAAPLIPSE